MNGPGKKTHKEIVDFALVSHHTLALGVDISIGLAGLSIGARAHGRERMLRSLATVLRDGSHGVSRRRRRVVDRRVAAGKAEAIGMHHRLLLLMLGGTIHGPRSNVSIIEALLATGRGFVGSGIGHGSILGTHSLVRKGDLRVREMVRVHHGNRSTVAALFALATDGGAGEAIELTAWCLGSQLVRHKVRR